MILQNPDRADFLVNVSCSWVLTADLSLEIITSLESAMTSSAAQLKSGKSGQPSKHHYCSCSKMSRAEQSLSIISLSDRGELQQSQTTEMAGGVRADQQDCGKE